MSEDEYAAYRDLPFNKLGGLTWYSREPLGHYSALGVVSSGPIAIIAGFVLASAVAITTSDDPELLDMVGVLVFALAAVALFIALLFVVEANAVYSTPADRLTWYPEAQISERVLDELRRRQRSDFARYYSMRRRVMAIYPIGIALALLGLALVVAARIDGTRLRVESGEDALADVVLGLGGLCLVGVAGYVATFAQLRIFDDTQMARYDRALTAGMRQLRWESTTPQGRAQLGKLTLLKEMWPEAFEPPGSAKAGGRGKDRAGAPEQHPPGPEA